VDEIRVAREAWMLERHNGNGSKVAALGKLSTELDEMRTILASIARTLPQTTAAHSGGPSLSHSLGVSFSSSAVPSLAPSVGLRTPIGSHNGGSPPQHVHTVLVVAQPTSLLLSNSNMQQHLRYNAGPELVRELEELYKQIFGLYPSRQSLIDFSAETMRINIRPHLPQPLPARSPIVRPNNHSPAKRSLTEITSSPSFSAQPLPRGAVDCGGADLTTSHQCSVCGSPIANRGSTSAINSFLSPSLLLKDVSHDESLTSSASALMLHRGSGIEIDLQDILSTSTKDAQHILIDAQDILTDAEDILSPSTNMTPFQSPKPTRTRESADGHTRGLTMFASAPATGCMPSSETATTPSSKTATTPSAPACVGTPAQDREAGLANTPPTKTVRPPT